MDLLNKPYRHRFIWIFIKLAVVLYVFLSSEDVKAVMYYVFRVRVSGKTVCEWAKKFPIDIPDKKVRYKKDEDIILFTDEKYIWIKKVQAYWWSVKDHQGNVLANIITMSRDTESAKRLFRRAKENMICRVHAVVHDGLKSYNDAVNWIFGRKCQSIIAGIQGKFVIINNKIYWVTNNSAESLNAQIDSYLTRHHYNFNNLKSANYFADMFLYRKNLRELCT